MEMQVAILSGGFATRLGELTKNRPKSLIEIKGKPFLQYQLEFIKKGNVEDIVLCTGHLGDQIENYFGDGRNYGVKIKYSRETRPLGTAGALKQARGLLKQYFFTMYGDSYLFLDFESMMSFFLPENKLGMVTVYLNYNQHDRSNIVLSGDMVSFYSKHEKVPGMDYIDYGACLFRREVLDLIPDGQAYDLEALFQQLIARKQLLAFRVDKRFYEIGSPDGLKSFEEYVGSAA